MWTGTPYDHWQKRLGVTLFTTPVLAFAAMETGLIGLPGLQLFYAAWLAVLGGMAGLVLLRKLYFSRAKAMGRAFDNVDY